ncbi:MAG TPA: CDP-diacylglycerol--serine O-phosphatidyltransferase [Candidatus Binatia bacterium]|nr:CDP-diacylglycerol--serine O-phosphatidyltransferase [Candidatus Binatia bacterium]
MAAQRRRHFTLIRDFSLADLITLANGFAGTGSILATLQYMDTRDRRILWLAFALPPLAMVLDFLDGRVARWRHRASPLGRELDSLADLISFGVAPAVLAFAVGLRGAWDAVVLVYFVSCGLSRLARYNVTAEELADESGKVKYFEGTPIPTSVILVAFLALLTWYDAIGVNLPLGRIRILGGAFHPLVLVFAVSGSAMISKTLRIPKW